VWAQSTFLDLSSYTRTNCTSAPTRFTSENALAAGERNIRELKQRLDAAGGSTHGIRFDACAPRMSLASTIVERLRLKPCSAHVDDVLNRDEDPA
jgi:hypothetical protein